MEGEETRGEADDMRKREEGLNEGGGRKDDAGGEGKSEADRARRRGHD